MCGVTKGGDDESVGDNEQMGGSEGRGVRYTAHVRRGGMVLRKCILRAVRVATLHTISYLFMMIYDLNECKHDQCGLRRYSGSAV